MQDSYTIIEHRHRFALWAAGRAYSRQGPGHTMAVAKKLLCESDVDKVSSSDDLPPRKEMDAFMDECFQKVMTLASGMTYTHKWTDKQTNEKKSEIRDLLCYYGRAQKLVNVYLKSKLVCAGNGDEDVIAALHPPLDRQFIEAIGRYLNKPPHKGSATHNDYIKASALGMNWTTFDKTIYDAHIRVVKAIQGTRPLWGIEWPWQPTKLDA